MMVAIRSIARAYASPFHRLQKADIWPNNTVRWLATHIEK
jgi:hypothetical protein